MSEVPSGVAMRDIPTKEDWGSFNSDFDKKSAFEMFYGKSNAEVEKDFYRDVLSRVSELRVMPDIPFRYYMIGFRDFVLSKRYRQFTEADVANSFLEIIQYMLLTRYETISPIIHDLLPTVDYVVEHQDEYGAMEEVYGDFNERKKHICELAQKSARQ